jgi:hypothetical protein
MKMYLLLRNNKQSGPHSLDDLRSMGLKAYDLVWLEGKSAAWRYPSEIEELSPFAPIVEEQPFDRFYKKASPATSATTSTAQQPIAVEVESSLQRSSPLSSPMSTGKRIIYVTMPAGKSPVREIPVQSTVRELQVREPAASSEPIVREREQSVGAINSSYARAAIEDYSTQPTTGQTASVDYLPRHANLPYPKSRNTSFKKEALTRFVAIGLCILALLAAGIFIGLSLNKDTLNLQHKMVANATGSPANAEQRVDHPTTIVHPTAQQLPAPAVTSPSASTRQESPAANTSTVPTRTAKTNQKTKPVDRLARGPVQYTTTPAPKDSATTAVPSMQREAVHRSDNAETNHASPAAVDKEALRATLASQINVGANTYSVGTFGGISNLQVTVTNRSAYPLDLVVVEVQYVQANKKVFKTENLYFRSIGAGSAMMLEAPKSARGIKVQYKVTDINSRELGIPGV